MVPLPLSKAPLLNGHLMISSAHGDHANYPLCKRHSNGTYEEIFELGGIIPGTEDLAAYDHICTEHNYRLPNRSTPELGRYRVGDGALEPENLASKRDIEKFSCWQGLFGLQEAHGPFAFLFGTSPKAPLRQLDKGLEEAGLECPEVHNS